MMEDGARIVSMAEIQSTTGPRALVEARGLLSSALRIDRNCHVNRERINWRVDRAALLLKQYLESEAK